MFGRLCFALLAPLVLGGGWVTVAPKDAGFVMQFPAAPVEDRQDIKTPAGDVTVNVLIHEIKNQGTLAVSYSLMPEGALKAGTDDKRLDGARDLAVQSAKGKLKSEKKIKQDGYPGRELVIEGDGKTPVAVRTRIYAVKDRLYQTMASGSKTFVTSKEADKFLNSFKLAGK